MPILPHGNHASQSLLFNMVATYARPVGDNNHQAHLAKMMPK